MYLAKHWKFLFGYDIRRKQLVDVNGSWCGSILKYGVCIGPGGEITKCEHIKKEAIIGNVNDLYDKNIDIDYDKFKNYYFDYIILDECQDCNFKPLCHVVSYCDGCNHFGDECPLINKYQIVQSLEYNINHYYNYINIIQ